MIETVFAYHATSSSSDHYLGLCRVPQGESAFGHLQTTIKEELGEEYAYLESIALYTDDPVQKERENIRFLCRELVKDFQLAYEAEQ